MNDMYYYSHQNTQQVRILISNVNFFVTLSSPLEHHLKELERLYHLIVDQVDLNRPLIETALQVNSFLKIIYSDFCKLSIDDEREQFLKTLFDTALGFIEIFKKNKNLDERDRIVKLISKTPVDIYENFFASKLDQKFYFILKMHHWLKLENKLYIDRSFFRVRDGDEVENSLFSENELNDFFINRKWEIINYLQYLADNGCKQSDGTYKVDNPLNYVVYKTPYEMSNQISGLRFVDVNE